MIEDRGGVVITDTWGEMMADYDRRVRLNMPAALYVSRSTYDSMADVTSAEVDQTDLGASDDRPLGPDHILYRGG